MTIQTKKLLAKFLRDEQGQDLIEYTLLISLICLAAAAAFGAAGNNVNKVWTVANTTLSKAVVAAS
jgi:Flp pilus assembly pilin Flp